MALPPPPTRVSGVLNKIFSCGLCNCGFNPPSRIVSGFLVCHLRWVRLYMPTRPSCGRVLVNVFVASNLSTATSPALGGYTYKSPITYPRVCGGTWAGGYYVTIRPSYHLCCGMLPSCDY